MKVIKTLSALTLTAAMVPALALGTAALADEQGTYQQRGAEQQHGAEQQRDTAEQRAGMQRAGEQEAGEPFMSSKPTGAFYADDVIGKTVKQRQSDEDIGKIQDLLIGDDGRILGAVVTSGTFLGLGGRDVALGWDHLEHSMEDDDSVFYTDMDEETLKNAPEYERE